MCALLVHHCIHNMFRTSLPHPCSHVCIYSISPWTQVLALACFCATDGSATLFSPCICSLLFLSLSISLSKPCQLCLNCTLCYLWVHNMHNLCICRNRSCAFLFFRKGILNMSASTVFHPISLKCSRNRSDQFLFKRKLSSLWNIYTCLYCS